MSLRKHKKRKKRTTNVDGVVRTTQHFGHRSDGTTGSKPPMATRKRKARRLNVLQKASRKANR